MEIKWNERAWADYLYWQEHDKKSLRKINKLLEDITETGSETESGTRSRSKVTRPDFGAGISTESTGWSIGFWMVS